MFNKSKRISGREKKIRSKTVRTRDEGTQLTLNSKEGVGGTKGIYLIGWGQDHHGDKLWKSSN